MSSIVPEAPVALAMPVLLAQQVQQLARVAGVEHPEARVEPERGGVHADQPVRDGVEGPAEDPAGVGRDALGERAHPLDHLAGRAARERQQQDAFGWRPLGQQPADAGAQRGRLAGAGAGEDQQRVAGVCGGGALLVVEVVEERGRVGAHEHLFATLGHCPDGLHTRLQPSREGATGPRTMTL
jgi:hypothetical protein